MNPRRIPGRVERVASVKKSFWTDNSDPPPRNSLSEYERDNTGDLQALWNAMTVYNLQICFRFAQKQTFRASGASGASGASDAVGPWGAGSQIPELQRSRTTGTH